MSETTAEPVVTEDVPNDTPGMVPDTVEQPKHDETVATDNTGFQAEVGSSNKLLDALMSRIGPVNQQSPYAKLFIYGPPGVGKSVLLGTAPNNLIIDVEEGAKSLNNHPDLQAKFGPESLEYKSIRQVELLVNFLKEDAEPLRKFKIVSVDSWNKLVDKALVEHVRHEASQDSSRNPYLPIGTDYNVNTQHMKQLADDIKMLDRHIVFLCHSREIQNTTTGQVLIRPALTDKIAEAINGMFDLVGYLTAEVTANGITSQRLQIFPTATILAKTRIGGLPAVIENPTLSMILEAYERARKSGNLK